MEGPAHRKRRADRMAERLRNTNPEDVDVQQLISHAISMAEQASKECDLIEAAIRGWSVRVAGLEAERDGLREAYDHHVPYLAGRGANAESSADVLRSRVAEMERELQQANALADYANKRADEAEARAERSEAESARWVRRIQTLEAQAERAASVLRGGV